MTTILRTILALVVSGILMLSQPLQAQAEQAQTPSAGEPAPAPAPPDPAPEQAEDSDSREILDALTKINGLLDEISALETKLNSAEGDELNATIILRRNKSGELVTELKQFSKLATAFSDGGNDLNELLKQDRDRLLQTGAVLRRDIDQYLARLVKNSEKRDTLKTEGLKSYTSDSELIDVSLALLAQYIDIIKSINFQPEPSIRYLQKALPERAEFLAGRIALSKDRQADYLKAVKADKENADARTHLALIEEKLKSDTDSLKLVIDLAKKFDIDMRDYQTLLVKATGEISSETLDTEVLSVLFEEWWLKSKFAIQENSIGYLIKVIVFVLIILGFKMLAKLAGRIIERSLQSGRVRASMLLQNMLVSVTSKTIFLMGVLVALSQLGVSLAPVLAGLGVVGFIVGFALQDTLGNFAAGIMILFYRPYDVGDAVEVGGVAGKVRDMSIVNTTILTFDNQTLILPNSKIWGDVIKNVTAQKMRRVDMVFGIGYGDDIEHAERVLMDIVSAHDKVLADPAPVIKLHNLGESSVDFVVRPWVNTADYWDVYWDITRTVKLRFDAEGISIPFPQRDVHLYQASPAAS
jgi:small conductance mechanosensitive channel